MSNAVKAKSWHPRFQFAKTRSGGPPSMDNLPVAASQTIVDGDPLIMTNGELSLAAATDTSIAGVAAGNVTTTAADEKTGINFYKAVEDNIFIGRSDARTDTIHEGEMPGIRYNAGYWYIDVGDDNATNVVKVEDKVTGDDETDASDWGRLYFIWNRSPYLATNA